MKNRFAGYCGDCQQKVEAGHGDLRKEFGRWTVRCGAARNRIVGQAVQRRNFGGGGMPLPPWAAKEADGADRAELELARRERDRDEAEYQRGIADARRYQDNVRYFGEDYAAAEELAWELKDPDPYY